jgi:hypothetical protein
VAGCLFAAATDFTWADVVIARQALRTMAAKMGLFMVVLTLSQRSSGGDWLGHSAPAPLEQVLS